LVKDLSKPWFPAPVQDLFLSSRLRYAARYPEINPESRFGFLFEPRLVRITYSNGFGDRNVRTTRRPTGSKEEHKRAN
jgi:hypothetical protein